MRSQMATAVAETEDASAEETDSEETDPTDGSGDDEKTLEAIIDAYSN